MAAPPLKLYDTKRKLRTLAEFKGKTIVLVFFPGAFTEVCTRELCTLRDSLANFEEVNAQIIAISVNDPFTNYAFAEQNRLLFPILSDFNRKVIRAYDIVQENIGGLIGYTTAKRSVFVISPEGFIRYKWITDNPGVEPPYSDVQHAVDELDRGRPSD
ncbi:MAG: redoxin domain-containing protein [Promethearchaeota archaeon]